MICHNFHFALDVATGHLLLVDVKSQLLTEEPVGINRIQIVFARRQRVAHVALRVLTHDIVACFESFFVHRVKQLYFAGVQVQRSEVGIGVVLYVSLPFLHDVDDHQFNGLVKTNCFKFLFLLVVILLIFNVDSVIKARRCSIIAQLHGPEMGIHVFGESYENFDELETAHRAFRSKHVVASLFELCFLDKHFDVSAPNSRFSDSARLNEVLEEGE